MRVSERRLIPYSHLAPRISFRVGQVAAQTLIDQAQEPGQAVRAGASERPAHHPGT